MNSKRVVVATNRTIKQMLKRCQDFEHMLLTADLDLALDDKYFELDKITKKSRKISKKSNYKCCGSNNNNNNDDD